jgi:hypothetical protein
MKKYILSFILVFAFTANFSFVFAANYDGSWNSVIPSNGCISATGVTYTLTATNASCKGNATANCYVEAGKNVTVFFPIGFGLAGINGGTVNGTPIASGFTFTANATTNSVSFNTPVILGKGATIIITLNNITNHATAGNYQLSMRIKNADATGDNVFAVHANSTFAMSTAPASAPTASAATMVDCFAFQANWAAVTGANAYFLDVSTSNTFATFVPGYQNLAVGENLNRYISGLNTNTTYYYRVRAANGTCQNPTNSAVITVATPLCYCASKATNTTYSFISNVRFNTIDNTSSGCASYTNFTTLSTTVNRGQSYTLTITKRNTCTGTTEYTGRFAAWIDWNRNGVFEAGEQVLTDGAASHGPISSTFTIPAGASLGATRMRCIFREGATAPPVCGDYSSWGETEDYTVNIVSLPTHCFNGVQDGNETGTDCGGSCLPCLVCPSLTCATAQTLTSGVTVTGCNVGVPNGPSTPENPDCDMSGTATVWYRFTTGPSDVAATVTIRNTCFGNPRFSLWASCGTYISSSCTNDFTLGMFNPLNPNTTYYLAVTDAGGDQCAFDVTVTTLPNNSPCVLGHTLVANATPPFQPGQTVRFTYTINSYSKVSCNWLQGIVPTFGPCWDMPTLQTITWPGDPSGDGISNDLTGSPDGVTGWGWHPAGKVTYKLGTSSMYGLGEALGAGWYYVMKGQAGSSTNDPNGTWGDKGNGTGMTGCAEATSTNTYWRVVFDINVQNVCDGGIDCSLMMKTFADGEIGSYTRPGCVNDMPIYYNGFADVITCPVLPVSMLTFSGDYTGENVLLKWATASEVNNDYFTVYRSADGRSFYEIGTVKGAGNSNSLINYQFVDKNAPPGVSYYQLKQVDFDGAKAKTEMIAVYVLSKDEMVNIQPNPVGQNAEIVFTSFDNEPVSIKIFDNGGKLIRSFDLESNRGINRLDVNLAELPTGVYMLTMISPRDVIRKKFIKN